MFNMSKKKQENMAEEIKETTAEEIQNIQSDAEPAQAK